MPGNVDTYAKQKAWHDRKKKKHQREAAVAANVVESECTFRPNINASSQGVKSRVMNDIISDSGAEMASSYCNTSSAQWGRTTVPGPENAAAVSSHVARQLEARRRRDRVNSGICFRTKKSALRADPFHLSSSNKIHSSTHASEKTVASQKQLFEQIEILERENSLLKIKHGKELIVLKEEMLNRSENALQKQAQSLMEKHAKDRDDWQAERKLLLELIESFKGELAQREEAKVKASALAEIIATAVNTLESNVIEIQHHTVEELRLLRGHINQNSLSGEGLGGFDMDQIRELFRENEKTMRQLLLGRERSSSEQISKLKKHAKALSEETSTFYKELSEKQKIFLEKHLEQQGSEYAKLTNLVSDYHHNSRQNWEKIHNGIGDLRKLSNEHHDLSHNTLPQIEKTLRVLSISYPAESAQQAVSDSTERIKSFPIPKEEREESNHDLVGSVVRPSASSSARERDIVQKNGGKDDAENLSSSSSVETEWIEVDQPDGKFYFNKFTKEVRKELPLGM